MTRSMSTPSRYQARRRRQTKVCRLCRARHNRHRFAVCTLLQWYRAEIDVEREIPKLATYLGHVHVNETYWYLEAVPELLELAARRLESSKEAEPLKPWPTSRDWSR